MSPPTEIYESKEEQASDHRTVIAFETDDTGNPYNWSKKKKLGIESIGTLLVLNSTLASSLPSTAKLKLAEHFNVVDQEQLILPTSVFLIGYILGPLAFAPISEAKGRRTILISTFFLYIIFTLATCFAPDYATFVVFRMLTGISASTPIAVTGGLYADIYKDPVRRGRAIAGYMIVASFGPAAGPVCGGYLAAINWRWPFWFALVLAGASAVPVLCLPETYGPAILQKRARAARKKSANRDIWAPIDCDQAGWSAFARRYLSRPLVMLFTEPIVGFSCLYLSMIYATLFLLFQAYAIIFAVYEFTEGQVGLAFVPVCIGCFSAGAIYLWWDYYLRCANERRAHWTKSEEYKRLPLAIIGGPLFTTGLFWIGWTSRAKIHWIVPMLGGLPIGIGFVLIFMALFNYMTDAYGTYAASALGASSIARSTWGVLLPFATNAMYDHLGVAWACSLLGFISLGLCLIPLVFMRFGRIITAKSKMCQTLAKSQVS